MNNGIVYVVCPANSFSGGADALHQMVYYLNQMNVCAKIVYKVDDFNKDSVSIPDRYRVYVNDYLLESDIVDSLKNIIVVSESYTKERLKYKNAKVLIWWLGINENLTYNFWKKVFFLLTIPLRMLKNHNYYKNRTSSVIKTILNREIYPFKNELPGITHLCASYYAFDYVSRKSRNKVFLCIEPISKLFLNGYLKGKGDIPLEFRKDVILFNPARNYNKIIKKISDRAPELKFEPLRGFNQQQLIEKYASSKLYIDFGAFPGAERIPKEAVLYGCAIITGKRGASGFYGDVPIPNEYKFDDPEMQIDQIVKRIQYVLSDYKSVYHDFDEYRETVLNLEKKFIKSLTEVFIK